MPAPDPGDEELLTVEQAAVRLGWPTTRVYEAVKAGVLPRADDGWAVRISAAELREYVENRATSPQDAPG